MAEHIGYPEKRKMPARQMIESPRHGSGLTALQVRRIVAALRQGQGERNIAESEGVPERAVRAVRLAEFERYERQMGAVGVAVGGMLESVRTMHAEIEDSVYRELLEGAA